MSLRRLFDEGAGLCPMAGVTDMTFRLICREMGAAFSTSEMVSAKGFLLSPGNRAAARLLAQAQHEGPVGLQLFGREPSLMAEAARQLSDRGFSFIDINMGCPAPKITSGGEGAALMKEPLVAGRVIGAVVGATKLPVTVKIRSGWDPSRINAPEIARIAEAEGARAITVHARTRDQYYSGRADRSVIAQVVRAVDIPVIGNGDIASAEGALSMLLETGCAGVGVGRAARGNPWIFREIACAMRGEPYAPPSIRERLFLALRHLDMLAAALGVQVAVREMRGHIAWYAQGARGCAKLRARINVLTDIDEIRGELMEFLNEG
jgi:tRNA-dihydrouridine synthase B